MRKFLTVAFAVFMVASGTGCIGHCLGEQECGDGCIPKDAVCCSDGKHCDPGYVCGTDGCNAPGGGGGTPCSVCAAQNKVCCGMGCIWPTEACCSDGSYCKTGFMCCGNGYCSPLDGSCCGDGYCPAGRYCCKSNLCC